MTWDPDKQPEIERPKMPVFFQGERIGEAAWWADVLGVLAERGLDRTTRAWALVHSRQEETGYYVENPPRSTRLKIENIDSLINRVRQAQGPSRYIDGHVWALVNNAPEGLMTISDLGHIEIIRPATPARPGGVFHHRVRERDYFTERVECAARAFPQGCRWQLQDDGTALAWVDGHPVHFKGATLALGLLGAALVTQAFAEGMYRGRIAPFPQSATARKLAAFIFTGHGRPWDQPRYEDLKREARAAGLLEEGR